MDRVTSSSTYYTDIKYWNDGSKELKQYTWDTHGKNIFFDKSEIEKYFGKYGVDTSKMPESDEE